MKSQNSIAKFWNPALHREELKRISALALLKITLSLFAHILHFMPVTDEIVRKDSVSNTPAMCPGISFSTPKEFHLKNVENVLARIRLLFNVQALQKCSNFERLDVRCIESTATESRAIESRFARLLRRKSLTSVSCYTPVGASCERAYLPFKTIVTGHHYTLILLIFCLKWKL